jgi:hypothetical protein
MKTTLGCIVALMCGALAWAAEEKPAAKEAAVNPIAGMLDKARIEAGWICLFDGQTPFGWKIEGDSKVADGALVLGGDKATTAQTTTRFGGCEVKIEAEGLNQAEVILGGKPATAKRKGLSAEVAAAAQPEPVVIKVPAGKTVKIHKIALQPTGMKSIFNGKDLTGWKPVEGKPSVFTVTDKGEINVKNGSGELQSDWEGDNFVYQMDVISNGPHLNSGIFFRALHGEFWQGYEVQIRNQWKDEDRTDPVDFGTGALYARQKTRKVIPSDGEWFTITLVADGAHLSTWVNGYQCTDYVDEKPDAPSARKGRFLGKGCIGLQGHDPTTDLSFKNIRVADLPKAEAK